MSTSMGLLRVTGREADFNQLAGNRVYMQQQAPPMRAAQGQHPWSPGAELEAPCARVGMDGRPAEGTASEFQFPS